MNWNGSMNWYGQILSSPTAEKRDKDSRNPKPPSDDVELFARFLGGDDSALVKMFDRHNHRLYLYCLQFVNDASQAEDLTQELWERIIRLRSDRQIEVHNPLGLMLTIARNLCIDTKRKSRRHTDLDDLPETSHPVSNMPELSHLEELVILALPHLPVSQREVLALHAYSGYRFDEIAQMLGEPVGAIRTRAWRARAHLGRIISAMIGLDDDNKKAGGHDQTGREQ
jgi:RNA polymerase sigma-70 factor (ECF subfamily)